MYRLFVVSIAALLVLTGCEQLTATVQGVSVLTKTPDLNEAQDMDAALAEALPLTQLSQPNGVGIFVGLAEKESATSTAAPDPVAGAQVRLEWDGKVVTVCEVSGEDAAGTYGATNIPTDDCGDEKLEYTEQSEYTTSIETGTDLHTITVKAPAAIDAGNVTFTPPMSSGGPFAQLGLKARSGGDLTVDWSVDPSAKDRHAFLTLLRITCSGVGCSETGVDPADVTFEVDAGNPIYDNAPRKPGDMIDLVLNEPVTSETIPESAFTETGVYLLILTPVELSLDVSSNLALGSGAMAGTGTAWVFWVN